MTALIVRPVRWRGNKRDVAGLLDVVTDGGEYVAHIVQDAEGERPWCVCRYERLLGRFPTEAAAVAVLPRLARHVLHSPAAEVLRSPQPFYVRRPRPRS